MGVRFVDDAERLELLRGHIKVAAEIVETFRVAYEDGIVLDSDKAQAMLDEALNRLQCAHLDTFDSVESDADAHKIDVIYHGRPVAMSTDSVDDTI